MNALERDDHFHSYFPRLIWALLGNVFISMCAHLPTCIPSVVFLLLTESIMETPLLPRESGQFIAERSRDVFVEEEGVQKVAEMLYTLRHSDSLTASGWKKANPLAPVPMSDQGSLSTDGAAQSAK